MTHPWIQTVLLAALCIGCQRPSPPPINNFPTAESLYSAALEKAQLANKPLFIVFTQDEFWCHQLNNFEADEDIAPLLEKHFLLIHLRIDANPGAEQMYYDRGPDRGIPAYTIVDPHGNLLADSSNDGQNIGFPNTDDEVHRYLAMLKTASPEITAEEQTLLQTKLEARRVTDAPSN